jgi:hypothetical protein
MRLIGSITVSLVLLIGTASAADRLYDAFEASEEMTPEVSGFVEASIGYDWWDEGPDSSDATIAKLRGTIAAPIAGDFGVQVDVEGEGWWWDAEPGIGIPSGDAQQGAVTGHLFFRNPDRGSIGIVGGIWAVDSSSRPDTFSGGTIGAEGQLYLGNATLYAQGGYGHFDYPSTIFPSDQTDAFFVVAGARLFATDNTVIDGKVSYTDNDSKIMDYEVYHARIRAEHRIANTPFSAFASYEYNEWAGFDITEQVVRGGFRASFGPPTLIANDRYGASQESLFDIMAWN